MPISESFGNLGLDPQEDLKRLQAGCILLARELDDPNFMRSVVLLCQFGAEGSYGLVLNRPAKMPISEIFESQEVTGKPLNGLHKVYIGGPVQPEELQVLQITEETVEGAVLVAPRVHVGGHFSDLDVILSANPDKLRLFLGYSGWSGGQLEQEVKAGAWEVLQGEVHRVFSMPEELLIRGADEVKAALKGFL
jgi:putative transcriptional regulator